MALKVDTFEHDIADEIRRKEATLEEVKAIAKSTDTNHQVVPPKKVPVLSITLSITIILALLGIGGIAYYYYNSTILPPSSQPITIPKKDIPKITAEVTKVSPTLGVQIGRFVNSVEKKDSGYIISINNYSAVFAYMTRNEDAYIEELANLFTTVTQATTTQVAVKPLVVETPVVSTTTSTGTSTSTSTKTATSTKSTTKATSTAKSIPTTKASSSTQPTSTPLVPKNPIDTVPNTMTDSSRIKQEYTDLTVSNQNMRVYKNGKQTVIYSFVGTTAVLISDTPEGILALRGAILR